MEKWRWFWEVSLMGIVTDPLLQVPWLSENIIGQRSWTTGNKKLSGQYVRLYSVQQSLSVRRLAVALLRWVASILKVEATSEPCKQWPQRCCYFGRSSPTVRKCNFFRKWVFCPWKLWYIDNEFFFCMSTNGPPRGTMIEIYYGNHCASRIP